jgi:hypothetical protein
MTENDGSPKLESVAAEKPGQEDQFPSEPFLCPACGQLLAPSCRVCAACHHAIDPAEIGKETPATAVVVVPPRIEAPVRFPWPLFLSFFLAVMAGGILAESFIGPAKTQILVGTLQLILAIWVSIDAYSKRVPHPLRWGLGTMLPTWLIILPWYLVRRRRPEAPCPFVEARVKPTTLAALFILLAVLIYVMLKYAPPV